MASFVQNLKQKIKNNAVCRFFEYNKNFIITIVVPLALCPLPILIPTKPAFCAFILVLMVIYWMTECLPISVTSLLPVALFPLFGITKSKCVSQIYFSDTQMLFLGALITAICIEKTGLHEKLALRIMMLFGSNPVWILLGIMVTTGFLSLWIQNGAAASMMLPIVVALVNQITKYNPVYSQNNPIGSNQVAIEPTAVQQENIDSASNRDPENPTISEPPKTKTAIKLMKCFVLSIAYAASVGGAGTIGVSLLTFVLLYGVLKGSLVGTTPNLILKGYFDENYPDGGLSFITYMAFALPVSVIMIFFCWIVMCLVWLPPREWLNIIRPNNQYKKEEKDKIKENEKKKSKNKIVVKKELDPLQKIIREKYLESGPYTWEQTSIAVLFFLLAILWITRDLFFVPGWSYFFDGDTYVTDTTPCILIVIVMFAWPKKNIFKGEKYENLISWESFRDFPWDVIFLSGGSLAIAYGFEKSGLSSYIAEVLAGIMPDEKIWALVLILVLNQIGTEFTSNTSMASIFIPIADELARNSGINPIYYLLPLTVVVSLAFMLPFATSPNTVIYGSGILKMTDMAISGIVLKVIGIIVVFAAANLWLLPIFPNNPSLMVNNMTVIDVGKGCDC